MDLLSKAYLTIAVLGLSVPAGALDRYFNDFNSGTLGPDLEVRNYALEDGGSYSDLSGFELSASTNAVIIAGTATHSVTTRDGKPVGWVGKSLIYEASGVEKSISVECDVEVMAFKSGGGGFQVTLLIEFSPDDRIMFSLVDAGGPRQFEITLDENNGLRFTPRVLHIPNGEKIRMRLEFDTSTKDIRGFVNGELWQEDIFNGTVSPNARVGIAATARTPGDHLESLFDNLSITSERTFPGAFNAQVTQAGPRCVTLTVKHSESIRGGEIGIAYDPAVGVPVKVYPGPDLPEGAQIQFQPSAQVHCSGNTVNAGFTIGWVNSFSSNEAIPAGTHSVLKVCFALTPEAALGDCSPLQFVSCLGVPEAPVRNVVTSEAGSSIPLDTIDGQVCIREDLSIRRGDSNADGAYDISDAIVVLGCLFTGSECSPCPDASDANDDGNRDISDAVYLLNWRFLGGEPPPPPFPNCGRDTTEDALADCEVFALCQ